MTKLNHLLKHLSGRCFTLRNQASLPSLQLRSLPEETLTQFEQLEANTRNHLSKLPTLQVKLPSIEELTTRTWMTDQVVIARGPSFFRQDYLTKLLQARKMGHKFEIVCADGTSAYCLEKGLIPSVVVSCDPSERILRWFGDVRNITDNDAYFLKDRDTPRNKRALMSKEQTISLFDKYGEQLKVAINMFTHDYVLDRLMAIGAEIYLYLPMSDNEQFMRNLWQQYPRLLALNVGGNVGSASFSLARALGAKRICLLGFDFGYPASTPLEQTQYFDLIEKNPKLARKMFVKVKNPHLQHEWFTDIVYLMYAHLFTKLAEAAVKRGVEVTNCTNGGILTSPCVKWGKLTDWLKTTPLDFES